MCWQERKLYQKVRMKANFIKVYEFKMTDKNDWRVYIIQKPIPQKSVFLNLEKNCVNKL
jgi:hypothetical protein